VRSRRSLYKVTIKDPDRPRRFLNSYLLFFLDKRPELREKFSGFGEIAKEAGRMWRGLPKGEKEKYLKRAELGRKRFLKRLSKYRPPSQEDLFERYGTRPKRFLNSYCFFVARNFGKEMRLKPSFSFEEISRLLAGQWREMGHKSRAPYVHLFVRDWRRWKREMHLYRGGHFRHGGECGHCCQGTTGKAHRGGVLTLSRPLPDPSSDCAVCLLEKGKGGKHEDEHHGKM